MSIPRRGPTPSKLISIFQSWPILQRMVLWFNCVRLRICARNACTIVGSVSPQLSWTQYRYLIEILYNEKERNKQYEHEQPPIGLIICREAGREEVIYALDSLEEKIFIAKYKVKLLSETKIKKVIKKFWNTKGTGVKSWSVTNIGFLITNQDATPIFLLSKS